MYIPIATIEDGSVLGGPRGAGGTVGAWLEAKEFVAVNGSVTVNGSVSDTNCAMAVASLPVASDI
jgi:hypothetical protein